MVRSIDTGAPFDGNSRRQGNDLREACTLTEVEGSTGLKMNALVWRYVGCCVEGQRFLIDGWIPQITNGVRWMNRASRLKTLTTGGSITSMSGRLSPTDDESALPRVSFQTVCGAFTVEYDGLNTPSRFWAAVTPQR